MDEVSCEVADGSRAGETVFVGVFREQSQPQNTSCYNGRAWRRYNRRDIHKALHFQRGLILTSDSEKRRVIQDEFNDVLRQLNAPYLEVKVSKSLVPDEQEETIAPSTPRAVRPCVICHENEISAMIKPCKHVCLCVSCSRSQSETIEKGMFACPICRTYVSKIVKVYNV